ncbi:metalloprotease [Deinococcus hopiensis]|uniref:Peptidase M50 domain-containing protein n=1 Tax=Deinococcus hopiensis KR-140 TaxID=695939 RepID=A0A1W1UL40_9DEIO|nr:site-2 protease family protein [Deinococcus hopiensis]SMB81845.1 hypothetical protein SAMN00790413_04741 [Deinococcus hopiensis KR-140]
MTDRSPTAHRASTPSSLRRLARQFALPLSIWRLCLITAGVSSLYLPLNSLEFNPNAAFVWIAVFFLPSIVLHELGHALAGRLQGMRFAGLVAGPLKIELRGRRPALTFSTYRASGGQALLDPGPPTGLRHRLAWMFLAGPLTNLLVAAVTYPVLWVAGPHWPAAVVAPLFALSAINAIGGVMNLVPSFTPGMAVSDGDALLTLLRSRREAPEAVALGSLITLTGTGTLSPAWAAQLRYSQPAGDLNRYIRGMALHGHAVREEDRAEALRQAQDMVNIAADLPTFFRRSAALELVLAAPEPDPQAIDQALQALSRREQGLLRSFGTLDRALAVLAMARGDREAALGAVSRGLEAARTFQRRSLSRANSTDLTVLERLASQLSR